MKISIHLQEGFYKDEVVIFDDQKQIFHAENVTTRMQTGLATAFDADLPDENTNLRIDVPTRNISDKKEIQPGISQIGISLTRENTVEWNLSKSPFFYA